MEVSEKHDSEDGGRIIQYLSGLPFQCSIVYIIYWTGVSVHYQPTGYSCVDNTSKLYFILGTDIAIPRDYVKR